MSRFNVENKHYVLSALERMYAHEYYEQHKAEINSTSPYAVTDKLPEMRIVDNAIVTGHGQAVKSSSQVVRGGLFNTVKGVVNSVSGGAWDIGTKVKFDHVSMCPVTKREFTDEELKRYHDDWVYQVESYARNEARRAQWHEDPSTLKVHIKWQRGTAKLNYEDLEKLAMVNLHGKEVKELIESKS